MFQKSTLYYLYSTIDKETANGSEKDSIEFSYLSELLSSIEKEPSALSVNKILGFSDSYHYLNLQMHHNADMILN